MASVSSRTRSKNVPLFRCLPKKSKRLRKSYEDDMGLDHYVSRCKKMKVKRETFVLPKNVKVISIDDDDDVEMFDSKDGSFVENKCGLDEDNPISIGSDEYDESDEEHSVGFGADNEEEEEEEGVDVKEEVKNDESKGSGEYDDKVKNFVDLDNSAESGDDSDSVSDESEDDDSDDGDFDVDKVNDMDDDSSSGSPYDDDEEEEEEEEDEDEDEEKEKKKGGRKYLNVVEDLVREVMDRQSGISEMNNEEINVENSPSSTKNEEMKDNSPSVNNGEMEHSGYGEKMKDKNPSVNNEVEHSDYASVGTSNSFEKMNGSFVHNDEVEHSDPIKGSSSSSNLKETSEIQKEKCMQNVSDDDLNVTKESVNLCGDIDIAKIKVKVEDNADTNECVKVVDSHEGKGKYGKGLDVGGVSLVQTKEEEMKNEPVVFEFKYDAVDRRERQPPPVPVETPPSIWSFKKVGKVQKTKEDEEEEVLWDEMETALRESKAVSKVILLFRNI